MDRYQESKDLIDEYINISISNKDLIDDNQHNLFLERLKAYSQKLNVETEIDTVLFEQIISTDGCSRKWICSYLSVVKDELYEIFLRIYNLHQNSRGSQIVGSSDHYRFLLKNADQPLKDLGFKLLSSKNGRKAAYINKEEIIVQIVNQGLDSPEVWLSRQEYPCVTIQEAERYLDAETPLYKKYTYPNWIYFNISSFDYYQEFLEKYLQAIADLGDFVNIIYEWRKKK